MKKGTDNMSYVIGLLIIIALIIIAFMFIKNIDFFKEGFDKLLSAITNFK